MKRSAGFGTSRHVGAERLRGRRSGSIPLTIGEYFLALDARQEVDTRLSRIQPDRRRRWWSSSAYENCSSTGVQSLYARKAAIVRAGQIVIVHAIEPNRDRKPGRMGWQGKPWLGRLLRAQPVSAYVVLKVEGFDHRPFIAPRWQALSGDVLRQSGRAIGRCRTSRVCRPACGSSARPPRKLLNPPMLGGRAEPERVRRANCRATSTGYRRPRRAQGWRAAAVVLKCRPTCRRWPRK